MRCGRLRWGTASLCRQPPAVLGYRDHSGTGRAIRRIESGTRQLRATAKALEGRLLNP